MRYKLIALLICIGTTGSLLSQTCFVKKFTPGRIQEPLWQGDCRDSLATGEGILYDLLNDMRYRGEMKNGLPDGYGAFYDKYITEGTWKNGKPAKAGYYLREVRFGNERDYVFIENGMRFKLNDNIGFTADALIMPAKPDTNGFAERLSADSTYVPFPVKKKNRKYMPPPEYYASSLFFIEASGSGGAFVSHYYKRFLVQCKESRDWHVLYCKESFGKKSVPVDEWQLEPFESTNATKYKTAYEALKARCSCN
jgi:hypothetical protein